jgi:[ribosomal protein S18]-alanine N-acetyltransferase
MITPEVVFRSMQIEDLPKVREIDRLSFSMPWPESSFRFELEENEASRCWVTVVQDPETEPKIIGMAIVWQVVDQAHIATLAVHPSFRGLGIGEKMLLHILHVAQEEGMLSATLEVRDSNQIAQSLYQKLGFTVTGRRMKYYHDTMEDALIMTLPLPLLMHTGRM